MSKHFHEWTFDSELLTAQSTSGRIIRFTRQERALLLAFMATPKTVLNRERLRNALTRTSEDSSDRHIDFLINRIRRALGDKPRNPRFIATQYGEGYVWVAEQATQIEANTFLVLQPLHQQMPMSATSGSLSKPQPRKFHINKINDLQAKKLNF